jgi:hypothetical protein
VDATTELERARLDAETMRDEAAAPILALGAAHRALLDARRGTRTEAPDAAAWRARASCDKDVRALAERLDAMRRAELPSRAPLVVSASGAWLTPPDGARVALPPASPLRAVLRALASAHRAGRAASRDAILAAAWPGERILARAAAHRVHAAVSELRALGLERHLVLDRAGYRLEDALPLLIEDDQG